MILELDDGTRWQVVYVSPPEADVRRGNAVVTSRIIFTSFALRETAEYYCARLARAFEQAKVRKAAAPVTKAGTVKLSVLKICRRLEELEMSRAAFASSMGVKPQQVTNWLKGTERNVKCATAEKMAKVLSVSLDAIRRS